MLIIVSGRREEVLWSPPSSLRWELELREVIRKVCDVVHDYDLVKLKDLEPSAVEHRGVGLFSQDGHEWDLVAEVELSFEVVGPDLPEAWLRGLEVWLRERSTEQYQFELIAPVPYFEWRGDN